MARVPDDDGRDQDERDRGGGVRRGVGQPPALARRERDEREEPENGQRGAVFRQSGKAEGDARDDPEDPHGGSIGRRGEEHARQRQGRRREGEQQRPVRHDPGSGGSEEEGSGVQRKEGDDRRPRAEQRRGHPEIDPARRREQENEGQTRAEPLAERRGGDMRDPLMERRMIEIGEVERARDRKRVALVDAGPERQREDEPGDQESCENGRRQPI